MNPVPLIVKVKLPPRASTVLGEILEIEGTGLVTVSVTAADVPPPGAGVKTVIDSSAPTARSDAGRVAVNCVLLTNVVVRFEPLTCITDPWMKLLPLTVSVSPFVPAETLFGEILERDGSGLLIVRLKAALVPPPGAALKTVIERVPGEAISVLGIAAVS